jgi:hypothetical protein
MMRYYERRFKVIYFDPDMNPIEFEADFRKKFRMQHAFVREAFKEMKQTS